MPNQTPHNNMHKQAKEITRMSYKNSNKTHTHTHTDTQTSKHTHTHTLTRTHRHTHTHTHTHTHAHARTHACTHAHTHTHARVLPEDYCKEDPCTSHGMGSWRGIDQAKSWPTSAPCRKIAMAISYCFSPRKSAYRIRLARGDQELDTGCQFWTRTCPF